MVATEKVVQKAALKFLKENGPLTRASMDRLNKVFDEGRLDLKGGLTREQAIDAIKLAQAYSYSYLGQDEYMNGPDITNAEDGAEMLAHPSMKSPETIRQVADIAQVPEFTEAAQAAGIVPSVPAAPDTSGRYVEQAGAGNAGFDERMGYDPNNGVVMSSDNQQQQPPQELPGQVVRSASGRAYQRVSSNAFHSEDKAVITGTVTMKADGRGGTYRGRATGQNDSRVERQVRKQMFAKADGTSADVSNSRGG